MKTKHGLLFGFAVIAIAAMFTLAGCKTEDDGGNGNGNGNGDGNGDGGGVTTSSFEGAWEHSYNSNTLTVTKVAGQDKFTLVYTSSWGTYTYTLSYTGSIAEVIQDNNPDNPLGKGVPFTGTGTRTSGNGYNGGGSGTTDVEGLFKGTEGIAITSPAATNTTPAGYLLIDGTELFVYYEDENVSSPITIGGKKHYGDQKFNKASN